MNGSEKNLQLFELSNNWTKHISLLSLGAALVMTIFWKKIAQDHEWTILLTVAIISLVFSILGASLIQFERLIKATQSIKSPVGRLSVIAVDVSFIIGIISVAAFIIRNLS